MGKHSKTPDKAVKSSKKDHASSKKDKGKHEPPVASSAHSEEVSVDTTGMSARKAKKALKEAAANMVAEKKVDVAENNKPKKSKIASSSAAAEVEEVDDSVEKIGDSSATPIDTSGMSAREAKRIKKAAKRAALEQEEIRFKGKDDTGKTVKSTKTSTEEDKASKEKAAHEKKLSKVLPPRQEKARREVQRAIQKFVADLREKGVTDAKEIKKEKLKYRKGLAANKSIQGYNKRK